MLRTTGPALCLLFATLAACKIQHTPEEFLDRPEPAAEERQAAQAELETRLAALSEALNRGGASEIYATLSPASRVSVIGLDGEAEAMSGAGAVAALRQGLPAGPVRVLPRFLDLTLTPRARAAWFSVTVSSERALPTDTTLGGPRFLRASGVFLFSEGAWRLVQLHLSAPAGLSGDPAAGGEEEAAPPAQAPPASPKDGSSG